MKKCDKIVIFVKLLVCDGEMIRLLCSLYEYNIP